MTTERSLEEWRTAGIITADQAAVLTALVRKERLSIHFELSALLYIGVVAIAAGIGWTVREHFASLGDAAILVSLGALFAGSLTYCAARAAPFSATKVESPTFAFDYVLYLGCLAFAVTLGYVEYRYHLLRDNWDLYLLASAVLYFACAYRYDNRFVLSIALSTLAAWFGVRLSTWDVLAETMRGAAIAYGALVAAIGLGTHRRCLKPHFLDAYLHVAGNAVLLAPASGAVDEHQGWSWTVGLLVAAAAVTSMGVRYRRFAFVAYGVVYGYIGLGVRLTHTTMSDTALLTYFVVSGIITVVGLGLTAARLGRSA